MSALYGLFNFSDSPITPELLAPLQRALQPYGRDGGAHWAQGNVGIGAQLSHFTPEDLFEVQPLVCPNSGRVLVADARLDNRPELIEALGLEASAETPDSLLIMRAFDKWGVECVSHLIGAWAFALWDAPKNRLMLARDPMGARTICWHRSAERLAFATTARALTVLPDVAYALNLDVIADMLASNPADSTRTFVREISELPLASRLIVTRDQVHIERYWAPDYGRETRLERDEDYVEAFRALFDRVMSDNLRTLSPVGVMMSGGLDSAAIGATAARQLQPRGERVTAFTEVPRAGFADAVIPRRYADETPYVEAIAAMYSNLDVEWVRQGDKNLLHDDENYLQHHDGPFGTAANRVWWEMILREAGARGIQTVLDGMQGNVAFSWNGSGLLAELVRQGKWRQARREARFATQSGEQNAAWRALVRGGIVPQLPASLRQKFVGWRQSKAEAQHEGLSPLVHPDFAREFDLKQRRAAADDFMVSIVGVQTPEIRWSYFLLGNGFGSVHAAHGARFGVDTRRPLCDIRLVEWCIGVPEAQCKRDGQARFLVRRAMADRLPPLIINNRKRGLQAADWLEHLRAARPAIAAEIERIERSPTANSVMDVAQLRRLFEELPADLKPEAWQAVGKYRVTLEHGVMFGRYLRSFDEAA